MTHKMPEVTQSSLTPAQAADVLRYYDASENEAVYANNWRVPKVKLGQIAIHTTQPRHSILPNGEVTLTIKEASEGLEYLLKEKETPPRQEQISRVEPSDEQARRIEELVDKIPCSYDEAYRRVMG